MKLAYRLVLIASSIRLQNVTAVRGFFSTLRSLLSGVNSCDAWLIRLSL